MKVSSEVVLDCLVTVFAGLERLCHQLSALVSSSLRSLSLQQQLSLSELELIFLDIFQQVKSEESDTSIINNPGSYFFPSTDQFLSSLAEGDREEVKKMLAETLDVLESEDTRQLVNQLCR